MFYKINIALLISGLIFNLLLAQLNESFDNPSFPPEGWRIINNDGGNTWQRKTVNYNTAPACVGCFWSEWDLTNDDWLITPRLQVASGDSLVFSYRTVEPVQESIEVRLSFNGPRVADFNRVLWARRTNNTSYSQAKINLTAYADSTVYIAFRYRVQYPLQPVGVGVYLDDIIGPSIYTLHDVGVTQILSPIGNNFDTIFTPAVKVKNFGSYQETIPVFFKIDGTTYEQMDTTTLLPGTDTIIYFPSCTLSAGSYNTISYTLLANDDNPSNDTCQSNFLIRTTNIWQNLTPFPKIVKTSGTSLCYDESNFIYCVRASDSSFYAYNLTTGNWEHKRGIPIKPKSGLGIVNGGNDTLYALTRNKKIFYKYSTSGNEWVLAESVPIKTKTNTGICRLGDYIYCLPNDSAFFRFSIIDNIWQRLNGIPVKIKTGSALTADTFGFLYALQGTKNNFYRYSISTNIWTKIESAPIKMKKGAGLASDGYNIYCIASGKTRKFYKYNPVDKWQELESVPSKINGGSAITYAQGKVYCLHGTKTSDFWRYIPEPSKNFLPQLKTKNNIQSLPITNNQFPQTATIYNVTGQLIKILTLANNQTLNSSLKNFPKGIYFVSVKNEKGLTIESKKLIIIK